MNKGNLQHGHKRSGKPTPEYTTWRNIIQRCHDPKRVDYPRYGGRGIKVCDRWRHSFADFLQDMGQKPGSNYSIDRINSGGDYSPENCRWILNSEQSKNRSSVRLVTHGGRTQCVADWAREIGVTKDAIYHRLDRGVPAERLFYFPHLLKNKENV